MEQFARAWKDEERCEWDGIRPGMSCFANRFCGFIHEHGRGLECEEMQSRRPNNLALVLLGTALLSAALLPWLGCSRKNTEVAAAPSSAPAARPAPTPEASAPASDS